MCKNAENEKIKSCVFLVNYSVSSTLRSIKEAYYRGGNLMFLDQIFDLQHAHTYTNRNMHAHETRLTYP